MLTTGITESFPTRVHIDPGFCFLDVGSTQLGSASGPKSVTVRHLKSNVGWVQFVARQSVFWLLHLYGD